MYGLLTLHVFHCILQGHSFSLRTYKDKDTNKVRMSY